MTHIHGRLRCEKEPVQIVRAPRRESSRSRSPGTRPSDAKRARVLHNLGRAAIRRQFTTDLRVSVVKTGRGVQGGYLVWGVRGVIAGQGTDGSRSSACAPASDPRRGRRLAGGSCQAAAFYACYRARSARHKRAARVGVCDRLPRRLHRGPGHGRGGSVHMSKRRDLEARHTLSWLGSAAGAGGRGRRIAADLGRDRRHNETCRVVDRDVS